MRVQRAAVLILLAVMFLPSCQTAPEWTVTGVWVNSPIRTDSTLRLVLRQSGDSITGVACSDVGSLLLWTGAQIEGQFPDFTFTVRPEHSKFDDGPPAQFEGKALRRDSVYLWSVVNGQLVPRAELRRSSDQAYQCPPLSALQ